MALAILWIAEKRTRFVSRFFEETRTATDLAVVRIVLVAIYLDLDIPLELRYAKLDPALIFPPFGWGPLATWFPRDPRLVEAVAGLFFVFGLFALVGLWTRISMAVVVALGFYLFTIPQLFGKIGHNHHLVLFGLLLALSPCGDALSVDALLRKRRGHGVPALAAAKRYAQPIQAILLLMGVMYFFPGAWKLARNGLTWFTASSLRGLIAGKLAEEVASPLQLWILHQSALLVLGAVFTIVFELGWLFAAMNKRTRPLALIVGLTFHNMTNLLMGIPFTQLQVCYVALVNWGAVFGFFSTRARMARNAASEWVATRHVWSTTSLGRPFTMVASILLTGMVLAGIGHADRGWPIACYPTFDNPPSTLSKRVLIEATASDGNVYRQTLSYDPVLQQTYVSEAWRGMLDVLIKPGQPTSEPRARAIVSLWEQAYHRDDIVSASLFADTYDSSVSRQHPISHRLVATVETR